MKKRNGQGASVGGRGWTMWMAVWLATVLSSLLAVVIAAQLASETFESSLEESLATQIRAQAGMAAAALEPFPVETVAALGGDRSTERLRGELERIRTGGGLHDLAVIGPEEEVFSASNRSIWVVAEADEALIVEARGGTARSGPLYRGVDGALYLAAYTPLPGHPGWVVAAEGSGVPLEAADRMEWYLAGVGLLVMVIAILLGAALARAATHPLRRLAADLASTRPGSSPKAVALQGPWEVRRVASAARDLLAAVQEKDEQLTAAHEHEVRQISALSAAVAHEVRNPLNALGLAVERVKRGNDEQARALKARVWRLIEEIDGIVVRFMDLSRPPEPQIQAVEIASLFHDLGVDAAAAGVQLEVPVRDGHLDTDPNLVRQALRNLFLNAAQAGARTVRLRVAHLEPLSLEVEDDGPGIDPGQVDHLFDWFHTSRATGSGLGLPSARRALRALGGDLRLENARPAVFLVSLGGND